ncbi:MAG: CehA/McbA family metallohydrolase [Planctomycetota bacterium]|nr:CehA/McbA family metallohydrolase [Planctomycetota bacterium]
MRHLLTAAVLLSTISGSSTSIGAEIVYEPVEGQPLAANVGRLAEAFEFLGQPLPVSLSDELSAARKKRDAKVIQKLLDPLVVAVVSLNPEVRVKVERGPGAADIQQGGFTPLLIKVVNHSTVASQLRVLSPQGGPVYAGSSEGILLRQAQTELKLGENTEGATDRFLAVEMFQSPPMTRQLSGLEVEYAIVLVYSSESGKREATLEFDVGAGTQDLGFRGEVPILLNVKPAIPVKLSIYDVDGQPTVGRLIIHDRFQRVYPSQAKRLAPDFFFQPQIYRQHGDVVLLPPGEFDVEYSRGPEYLVLRKQLTVTGKDDPPAEFRLKRWVDPMTSGFYCGDHHIHGAGCSHYDSPTKGVSPQDMFLQVKGEGLNVGCVLTWGPCFEFQRDYFSPKADVISEASTVLKYDLEISGFGSAALGHVCLLNLKDQTYPGSEGTKDRGWPTWTVPVLNWCKDQGGVTGYPHSALQVNSGYEGKRLLEKYDSDASEGLDANEIEFALMPEPFAKIDTDGNTQLSFAELSRSVERAANELPNTAIPFMNGGGALEICVSTAEGVCDFISAMDTARIPEWNTWYHLMNCGFPLKLSGETDFPCMSSRRVGQGRVYVQLGKVARLDFEKWCNGIAAGQSYVSDGFAHALEFSVDSQRPGFGDVELQERGTVKVKATVAFAPATPIGVAYGNVMPSAGRRIVGDTVNLHAPRSMDYVNGGKKKVEIVVNGEVFASVEVPADGQPHEIEVPVRILQSSWVALRHFPQLHTNPVNVIVEGKPIRASADSARWCQEVIKELWKFRSKHISEKERPDARAAYDRAEAKFAQIAFEAASVGHGSGALPPEKRAD